MSRIFEAMRQASGTGIGQDGEVPTVSGGTGQDVGAGDDLFKAETTAAGPPGDQAKPSPEAERPHNVVADRAQRATTAADGFTPDRLWAAAPLSQSTKRSRETLHVVTPKASQSGGPVPGAPTAPAAPREKKQWSAPAARPAIACPRCNTPCAEATRSRWASLMIWMGRPEFRCRLCQHCFSRLDSDAAEGQRGNRPKPEFPTFLSPEADRSLQDVMRAVAQDEESMEEIAPDLVPHRRPKLTPLSDGTTGHLPHERH